MKREAPIGRTSLDDAQWDEALVSLGGHPLQSAHWGRARDKAEGRPYIGVAIRHGERIEWMARAEVRSLRFLGKAAWIPRGPTVADGVSHGVLDAGDSELKKLGFALRVGTPWRKVELHDAKATGTRTIWIDLASGRDALWAGLQKKWRHGVGYAKRAGVHVEQTRSPERVTEFFRLCQAVSESKGFDLPASEPLLGALLASPADAPVASHLFIATCERQLAAGAFILRCGRHIHYFWGATDRELARNRPGEALHWAIIDWALGQGCTLYDLEGIDPEGNAGTYEFKRKMGGEEIGLPDIQFSPLDWRGRLIAPVLPRRLRL